jgi:hypothetical protein
MGKWKWRVAREGSEGREAGNGAKKEKYSGVKRCGDYVIIEIMMGMPVVRVYGPLLSASSRKRATANSSASWGEGGGMLYQCGHEVGRGGYSGVVRDNWRLG